MEDSGLLSIFSAATATYVDGYMKENPDCLYSCERGLKEEVLLTTGTQKIQVLFDQTLSGLNANQTVSSERPTLSTAKNAKRFYF